MALINALTIAALLLSYWAALAGMALLWGWARWRGGWYLTTPMGGWRWH